MVKNKSCFFAVALVSVVVVVVVVAALLLRAQKKAYAFSRASFARASWRVV